LANLRLISALKSLLEGKKMNRVRHGVVPICALLLLLTCACNQNDGAPKSSVTVKENEKKASAPAILAEPTLRLDGDAKSTVIKAIAAHGGVKAFSRWNCGFLKYKPKATIIPGALGDVTLEDTFQLPGHFKRLTRMISGEQELVQVFVINHGKGWAKRGNAEAQPLDNNASTEAPAHLFLNFFNLPPLLEEQVSLTKLGAELLNGRDVLIVRAQSASLPELDCYFDQQSGLLVKTKKLLKAANLEPPTFAEALLEDYRIIQGGMVPFRIKGNDGRANLDVGLIEARFAESFDEKTFAKP